MSSAQMREWNTTRALRVLGFYSLPNLQSGIGAFIGLVSLSLVWVSRRGYLESPPAGFPFHIHWQFTILDLIEHAGHHTAPYGWLFVIGAVVALASPIGGVFQGIGLIGIAFRMESVTTYGQHIVIGPGYLLAIASTLIVLTSVSAIRTANGGKPARATSRFAALSPGSMSVFS